MSLAWIDERVVVALPSDSQTARNIVQHRRTRLGLGPTRDVVMIDAVLDRAVEVSDVRSDFADRYLGCYEAFDLRDWLQSEPPILLAGKRISALAAGLPGYCVDIRLANILSVSGWKIASVVRVDQSSFYVEGSAELEGIFEVALDIHPLSEIGEDQYFDLVYGLQRGFDTDRLEETEESVFHVRFTLILRSDGSTESATMDLVRQGSAFHSTPITERIGSASL